MRRKLLCLVVAAGLLAGTVACEEPISGGEEVLPPAEDATPPSDDGDGDGEPADPPGPPPPADGVIASQEFPTSWSRMLVEITLIERQGQSLQLIWTMTNVGEDDQHVGYPVLQLGNSNTVDGTTLVDPVNGQRYLVARTGGPDGPCVCSRNIMQRLSPGAGAEYNALFSAPPPDVTQVNVNFRGLGVIANVPVY